MKRIIGTLVAFAGVLAIGTLGQAATTVIDVSGTGSANTVSPYAPVPPGYFITPFGAGSSVTLENDANGDLTTGDYTIASSILYINANVPIPPIGVTITTDVDASYSGGLGTLVGDDILWSQPAYYSATGTLQCTGNCFILGLTAGVNYPISVLSSVGSTAPVNPQILGTWDLNATLDGIVGSTRAVTSTSTAAATFGARASWNLFGSVDMGHTIPEPGTAALVILGLGALALRSRNA